MVPVGIIVEELHTFRVTFHRVDQAFQQVMLILLTVQGSAFGCQFIAQAFHFTLRLQYLLFCKFVVFL